MSLEPGGTPSVEGMIRAGVEALSNSQSPRLDARVLAKHVLGTDDAGLISQARERVSSVVNRDFQALIERRARGEPVAYIVGEKEFWGMTFGVAPDVLIPRADSECLIDALVSQVSQTDPLRILDLGTGSGALLCALLRELPQARGVGVDVSPAAINIATSNARQLGFADRAQFMVSDWFETVSGRFDIVIANAPYIPDGEGPELMIDVSDFEPALALFSGGDGLDAYRTILNGLPGCLKPSALCAFEYGSRGQGERLRELVAERLPGAKVSVIRDIAARERGIVVKTGDLAAISGT